MSVLHCEVDAAAGGEPALHRHEPLHHQHHHAATASLAMLGRRDSMLLIGQATSGSVQPAWRARSACRGAGSRVSSRERQLYRRSRSLMWDWQHGIWIEWGRLTPGCTRHVSCCTACALYARPCHMCCAVTWCADPRLCAHSSFRPQYRTQLRQRSIHCSSTVIY